MAAGTKVTYVSTTLADEAANERFEAAIAERTAAMRVSETKFRTLISNIPGVSYRCADDADYTMEFISDAIEQLSGYPAADFTNNAVRTYGSVISASIA